MTTVLRFTLLYQRHLRRKNEIRSSKSLDKGETMITMEELCKNPNSVPMSHAQNLNSLWMKLNSFRDAYGKPLRVTSGYRSMQQHLDIYARKGITNPAKIPMKSNHLFGLAADLVPVEDGIYHLHEWVANNEPLMQDIGIWFEDFSATKTWLHCQIVPPKSGVRFFLP